jgi:hypothetical protein
MKATTEYTLITYDLENRHEEIMDIPPERDESVIWIKPPFRNRSRTIATSKIEPEGC